MAEMQPKLVEVLRDARTALGRAQDNNSRISGCRHFQAAQTLLADAIAMAGAKKKSTKKDKGIAE